MGGYNSIEDLKNDETIRNLIKESLNCVFDMQEEYKENIKNVVEVDVSSQVIGSNEVDSGGGVMIGSGKNGIKINQKTNLQTEVQTMYYGNFLSKQNNPVIQMISSDMLNMTEKDNSEKEMPNFYDAVYVMNMLGFNVIEANFDFENDRVEYIQSLGMNGDGNVDGNVDGNETEKKYISFAELYEILTNDYIMNINEKIYNIREKVNNIKTNITRSTYNYAQNRISINGNLSDANLKQNNTSIQKMYDNMDKIVEDVEEMVRHEVNVDNKTNLNKSQQSTSQQSTHAAHTAHQSTTHTTQTVTSNSSILSNNVLLFIIIFAACMLMISSAIYYRKRKELISIRNLTFEK